MKNIDFKTFKNMLIQGRNNLQKYVSKINKLNVFPVPDGDTGTNMFQTVNAAVLAIQEVEEESFKKLTKTFSKVALMEACGNSGVILSQFFKGFSMGVKEEKITIPIFIKMFKEAKKYAYLAVKNATEGTILTLIRVLSEKLIAKQNELTDFKQLFIYIQKVSKNTIDDTPNHLQVLKDANVVDSGAFGLGMFIEGMIVGYNGKHIEVKEEKLNDDFSPNVHTSEIKEFGYCTEFVLKLNKKEINHINKEKINKDLLKSGNSTVVVIDEEILKVHIHSLLPGNVLNYAQKFGSFTRINISNMTNQVHSNKEVKLDKENIIIAVSSGEGIGKKMKSLGADYVVSGGQTLNPKTKDFIKIIDKSNAKNIIIMPNNKNIFLTIKQVQRHFFFKKKITMLETKTMWEGINSLMNFDPSWNHQTRVGNFNQTIKNSLTFEITNAIKNFKDKSVDVKIGDYIAIKDGKIVFNDQNLDNIFKKISSFFEKKEIEFVFIVEGDEKKADFETTNYFEDKDMEVEKINGNQKAYSYIIGGE